MRLSYFLIVLCLTVVGCAQITPEDVKPQLTLKQVGFRELPGWQNDDMQTAAAAFSKSCTRILKAPPDKQFGALKEAGSYKDWQTPCREFLALENPAPEALHIFFERYFSPFSVTGGGEPEGLFTGYYEASLKGSLTKQGPYRYPLHTRPDDLVMVQLGDFREELKGQRIAGRVIDGNLKPYESREQIVAGKWPHNDEVLVWVDNAVDAFFVQIQGSGIVELDDGSTLRIGYAGQNGHPYYAIGRELIKREELTAENVSMQSIREWLAAHPDEADEIMNTNKSYVFFTKLDGEGPIGGEGVALTAGRSLAIDRSLLSYGMPVWVDIKEPVPGTGDLTRLMVMQDTGGAITGPVRGDVFWGFGARAETLAGPMKSKGRYWVLLPK